jgi:hypothetical protein
MSATPETHAVYWPRGRKTVTYQPVSQRLASLEGITALKVPDTVPDELVVDFASLR